MASTFNAKKVHKDGKTELTIGVDENAKTLDGVGETLLIKNADGSDAKIAKANIPGMPESASETNKLVTQSDLNQMMDDLKDIINAANSLARVINGINDAPKED